MYVNVDADSVMLQYTYEMNLITNFKIKHKFFILPQDLPPPLLSPQNFWVRIWNTLQRHSNILCNADVSYVSVI